STTVFKLDLLVLNLMSKVVARRKMGYSENEYSGAEWDYYGINELWHNTCT
ncbi:Uncharacterized protein APZ42_008243, partial [Daphnia magna]